MNGGMRDGRPIAEGSPISDFMCAALLAYGVASALYRRTRTSRGGRVDTSLLMSALILQNNLMIRVDDGDAQNHAEYLEWLAEARASGMPYAEQASRVVSSRPARLVSLYYRTFTTRDSAIAIACPSASLRRRLLAVIGWRTPASTPISRKKIAMHTTASFRTSSRRASPRKAPTTGSAC